jgi:hypothetical protein
VPHTNLKLLANLTGRKTEYLISFSQLVLFLTQLGMQYVLYNVEVDNSLC